MPIEIEERLARLEQWRAEESIRIAVAAEQAKQITSRFDKIDMELGEIKGAFWRVAWIIVTAFVGIAVTFVMKGGLAP